MRWQLLNSFLNVNYIGISNPVVITNHIELLLEFFIGVIYAKLFKAVDFKCFKTVDVQNPDEPVFSLARRDQLPVDLPNDPRKQTGVNMFG